MITAGDRQESVMADQSGVRGRASIAGHPLHSMLAPFPIAFLVGAFASDLNFWCTGDVFWARASLWLAGAGLVTGLAAAVVALIDFLSIPRAREGQVDRIHFIGNAVVLMLALWNVLHRLGDPSGTVLPLGIILSGVVTLILFVTGWMGGELAYRTKIGQIDGSAPGKRKR
jgi:uncharacterized membrane protein